MATAMAQRPQTATASKVTTALSAAQSVAMLKNLVRASVGEICFLRNLFPSDVFRTVSFGSNTNVRALCPRQLGPDGKPTGVVLSEAAAALAQWVESALDALEKGYLRSIMFSIFTASEPHELLESYVCEYSSCWLLDCGYQGSSPFSTLADWPVAAAPVPQ
jgi:hypothetical protein